MMNGDKDNRINIVIMNRWAKGEAEPYYASEIKEGFIRHITGNFEGKVAEMIVIGSPLSETKKKGLKYS